VALVSAACVDFAGEVIKILDAPEGTPRTIVAKIRHARRYAELEEAAAPRRWRPGRRE
jgi:hypothetical protein